MSTTSGLYATNYYVSMDGLNTNSGLSLLESFETIQFAANLVVAGDTVFVLEGSYKGFDHRGNSGTLSDPIVFLGIGEVIISSSGPLRDDGINIEGPDWIVINNFTVNNMPGSGNGIRVVLSDHILIQHNYCDGNAERGIFTGFTDDITIEYNICSNSIDEHGIYVSNSSDRPVIRYNECFGNNNIGIHMNGDASAGGDGIISDARVYGNIIYDNNLAAGINMDGCENPLVYNNLIYNNHFAQGIALFQQDGAIATQGARIFNNTIIVPSDGRWGVLVNPGSHVNTKIFNNIIINNHSWRGCISTESTGNGFESDYNIVQNKLSNIGDGSTITFLSWQTLGLGINSQLLISMSDLFENHVSDPPELLIRSGSQAVGAGIDLSSDGVNTDIQGISRPQQTTFDIGAFERKYCPQNRILSIQDLPLRGQYYALDSIKLEGGISITEEVLLSADVVSGTGVIQTSSNAILKVVPKSCNE